MVLFTEQLIIVSEPDNPTPPASTEGHAKLAVPRAVEMVTEQGRMKFLRPIYR